MKHAAAILLIFAAAFGLVNIFLIPPFMNPDEIQHFMFTAEYAYNPDQLQQLDRDVLQILKDHKWFRFIGVGPGWERIKQIKDIFFLRYFAREKHSISKTYFHSLYGKVLALSGIRAPLTAFYFLRFLSFLFYLAIFALCLFFYRAYFPSYWIYMAMGQLLLFQPASILTSVNYDVLLTLLGVMFFIIAYRFMNSRGDDRLNLAALIILSALAALVKKGGLLFFVYFFLLPAFKYKITPKMLKRFGLALLAAAIVFVWFNYWFPGRFFTLYTALFIKLRSLFQLSAGDVAGLFNFGFFDSVMDSFYFHTGWMGFKIGAAWYLLLKLFFLAAVFGIIAGPGLKKPALPSLSKRWHVYALLLFIMQLLFIWLYYGSGETAQGRYLFPLFIPIITIIFCGLNTIETRFNFPKPYLKLSLLALQAVILVIALIRTLSVFYLQVASPHAGL
jgi:hypothetical protein